MDQSSGAPSQDEYQPDPLPEAATIGAELRRAREQAGLSLAEVAQRTKIRPGILTEIDEDAHDRLPALTYTLGFVKAYARTVGLDPATVAERYRQELQKADPVPTIVDLQPLEERRKPSSRLVMGSAAAVVLVLAGFWAWGAGWLTPAAPSVGSAEIATGEAPATAPAAVEVTPQAPAPNAAAPVTLTAREEVWLRIADGDETFFMGTMSPGQALSLPTGRAWGVRTGRAGALEVKVGERVLPPLGGPAEQLHGLSLQPADLLARAGTAAPAPASAQGAAPAGTPQAAPGSAPPAAPSGG